ncbi:MAG TPA: neutral zinc metallopeptidase [Solirubrobacteraceae bacterium]
MSLRVRYAAPLIIVMFVVGVGGFRLAPARQQDAPVEFKPFAETIVGKAPALPTFAADANVRIRQQMDSANAMWTTAFAAAGATYREPVLTAAGEGCGAPSGGWAGIYCDAGDRIVIDVQGHVQRHASAGQALEDVVLGYVVAHEVGHHVQSLRGAPDDVLRRELHADCLAGVWGKAAGIPLPPMWAYGEDAEHGTATQRVRWLNEGYRAARPAACDTIWSRSTSP